MQSYEHHVVHESLQKRHPYLQGPFSSEINPSQITVAVFDRQIPKFREVLEQENLDHSKCRDALKTLNEYVHHQETRDMMIDQELLVIAAGLLKHTSWEVREQAAILLSSFALAKRGRDLFSYAFDQLKVLLEDKVLRVREAVAYVFFKLSMKDDGA